MGSSSGWKRCCANAPNQSQIPTGEPYQPLSKVLHARDGSHFVTAASNTVVQTSDPIAAAATRQRFDDSGRPTIARLPRLTGFPELDLHRRPWPPPNSAIARAPHPSAAEQCAVAEWPAECWCWPWRRRRHVGLAGWTGTRCWFGRRRRFRFGQLVDHSPHPREPRPEELPYLGSWSPDQSRGTPCHVESYSVRSTTTARPGGLEGHNPGFNQDHPRSQAGCDHCSRRPRVSARVNLGEASSWLG